MTAKQKTSLELLEEIRAKLRYQARSQICTLEPKDCGDLMQLLAALEVATNRRIDQAIEIERDLRMQEVHKIALEDNHAFDAGALPLAREVQCACCARLFDAGTGSADDKRCGSCINCVGKECA